MSDDLVAFVQQMDRCWLEQRFDDLARYIARDVVMVAPGGRNVGLSSDHSSAMREDWHRRAGRRGQPPESARRSSGLTWD